jgi:hypothetical protein
MVAFDLALRGCGGARRLASSLHAEGKEPRT